MKNFKRHLFTAGATLAMAGFVATTNPTEASAQEHSANTWTPRSVEQIESEIEDQGAEGSKYTFQWGDTLSGIASASDLSINKLVKINDINNADMIFAGNSIHLSADKSIVSVEKNDEVVSYDVSKEEVEKVETPKEVEKELKEEKVEEQPVVEEEAVVEEQPAAETSETTQSETTSAQSGQTMVVEATAYSTNQPSLGDITYSGINLRENPNVIAVDPNVIPLGSTVHVPGYGTYIAGDTGSAIKGNRIDVHITDLNQAIAFGRQTIEIQILN